MQKFQRLFLFIALSVFLSACGGGGGGSSSTSPPPANIAPVANAGQDQTVDEGMQITLDGTASSDADGSIASYSWTQTSGPAYSLNASTTANPTLDALAISSTVTLVYQLRVTDNRGAIGSDTVTIIVNPVAGMNNAPVATIDTVQSATSGDTVNLNGANSLDNDGTISTYAWVQTAGPGVTINNANTATANFQAPTVSADTTVSIQLTVTDNESATATDSADIIIAPQPPMVTISGKATYDNVPHNAATSGLNYLGTTQDPIRVAVVELISGTTILQSGLTDNTGNYSFLVSPNSGTVFVRIKAHALLNSTASWDAKVVDNTNAQALYALDGSSFAIGSANISRPTMNAGSGWTGTNYGAARAAAPFHILDRVMDGLLKLQGVDANLVLPALDINWSPNNNSSAGTGNDLTDFRNGDASGTFYFPGPSAYQEFSGPQIFILGTENVDTDEYDGHVIVHEWGHYFENVLSRSDSIGGPHGRRDRLDMRLAFGEGFGNAWSAIITDDPIYRDSYDANQSLGFDFDVESNSVTNPGWYSEGSLQSILYDVYDTTNEGGDSLSAGLQPIYNVLVGPQKTTEAFTSIFSFAEYFRQANPGLVTGLNNLLTGQSINGTDIWGNNETNDAGAAPQANVLPVYTELTVGGGSKVVCSTDDYDTAGNSNDLSVDGGNKLGIYRYVMFNIPTTGNYRFLISANTTKADPAMHIYITNDSYILIDEAADGVSENVEVNLDAGNYIAEVYEYDNTNQQASLITTDSSDECFDVQIQTP